MKSENTIELVVYHGTDYNIARIIVNTEFKCRYSKEHWLGNGIYFYCDMSLAKWWTTNPTKKFGTIIKEAAIIESTLAIQKDRLLDLRDLDTYLWYSRIYKERFIPRVYNGEIVVPRKRDTGKFVTEILRCTFFDYLKERFRIDAVIGTFDLPDQPYLTHEYGEGFQEFSINYIEIQVCVFNPEVILSKEIIKL